MLGAELSSSLVQQGEGTGREEKAENTWVAEFPEVQGDDGQAWKNRLGTDTGYGLC